MKHLLITLAVVLTGWFVFPQVAQAGYRYGSGYNRCIGYSSCGCPIYQRRVIISRDYCGRPIYRYISVPVVHRCRTYYRPPVCPPPVRYCPPVRRCAPVYVSPYRYGHYRSHRGYRHSSVSIWGPNGGITWRR